MASLAQIGHLFLSIFQKCLEKFVTKKSEIVYMTIMQLMLLIVKYLTAYIF